MAITLRGVETILVNALPVSPILNTLRVNNFWVSLSNGATIGTSFKALQTISEPGKDGIYYYEKFSGVLYGLGNTIMEK